MLDIQLLRKQMDTVVQGLATRGACFDRENFERLELARRNTQMRIEQLQATRNTLSKQIGVAKSQSIENDCNHLDAEGFIAQTKKNVVAVTAELDELNLVWQDTKNKLEHLLSGIANLPDSTVPKGSNSLDNLLIRTWGQIPDFEFTVRDHVALGAPLGMDFESASKISGSRFVLLKGNMARLHRALTQFMLDVHTVEHGYTEVYVPYIVNCASMYGTGQLPKFTEDLFRVPRRAEQSIDPLAKSSAFSEQTKTAELEEDFYLIPTAEVPLTNMLRDTITVSTSLPLRYVAHTPCFRSEAGSYGKDTRGMIRQHQFDKVELVQMVAPEESMQALEDLTIHAETILQKLELPYRTVLLCTGDMGFASCKTYDIEVWLPSQKTYREISSCSNMGDFQARRIQARFRKIETKSNNDNLNKVGLLHTLNGSALAVGRTLVALLENYQQADGSVLIPRALQAYMGGCECLKAI